MYVEKSKESKNAIVPIIMAPTPVSKLLIANRGEIAARILSTALEHDIPSYTLHTPDDSSHTRLATQSLPLTSPAHYTNIANLITLCQQHNIDTIHPGYGFLSESAELVHHASKAGIRVIGPGAAVLEQTGDKIAARALAVSCNVPVLPALENPTRDIGVLERFAESVGYPVMIKAVDGGGGRGIRLVSSRNQLHAAATQAIEESPSKSVFAERAAVHGFHHIEVQIVGDGQGVVNLLERQCSIQRRFQKVVEIAPAVCVKGAAGRKIIGTVINAAENMAMSVKYQGLGTFEFLVNPKTQEYYFLRSIHDYRPNTQSRSVFTA